jgi:hypothetical protein
LNKYQDCHYPYIIIIYKLNKIEKNKLNKLNKLNILFYDNTKMNINKIIKDEEVIKNLEIKLKKAKEIHTEGIMNSLLKESMNSAIKRWIELDNKIIIKKGNSKLEDNFDKLVKERLYFEEYKKKS